MGDDVMFDAFFLFFRLGRIKCSYFFKVEGSTRDNKWRFIYRSRREW